MCRRPRVHRPLGFGPVSIGGWHTGAVIYTWNIRKDLDWQNGCPAKKWAALLIMLLRGNGAGWICVLSGCNSYILLALTN